jgi:hypothetical protein
MIRSAKANFELHTCIPVMDLDQDVVLLQCFWLVVSKRAHDVW